MRKDLQGVIIFFLILAGVFMIFGNDVWAVGCLILTAVYEMGGNILIQLEKNNNNE